MKFRIHNGNYEGSIVVEADTIEEIKVIAAAAAENRGWKNCWSEEIKAQ